MKKIFFAVFAVFLAFSAFCIGNQELAILELVNTQEISLGGITEVKVSYSGNISVFIGTADKLIIKEYMSENNSRYFAKITNSRNTVTIESGERPRPNSNTFSREIEVYLPYSYRNVLNLNTSGYNIETSDLFGSNIAIGNTSGNITVKSITADTINIRASGGSINIREATGAISIENSSGNIRGERIQGNANLRAAGGSIDFGTIDGNVSAVNSSGNIRLSQVNGSVDVRASGGSITIGTVTGDVSIENTSGNIRGERIQGNANLIARGGSIEFDTIDGNVSAENSSGNIRLNLVNGSVDASALGGSITCTVGTHAREITLNNTSGNIRLNLPRDLNFNFSSRITSGNLTTPFSDRLSSPVTDRNLAQGFIGNSGSAEIATVNVRASGGSIRVEWR